MKRILLFAIVALILLSSCGSISSFESPNEFRNIDGVLFLRNGKSFKGRLLINTRSPFGRPVKIYAEEDSKPMQFNLDEVKGYRVRNNYYELKEVKGGLRLGKEFSFMRRLTPEVSRIHLYEYLKKVTDNEKGYTAIKTQYDNEYYMQLPKEESLAVYYLGSSKFVPNFDEKMSRLLSDCPDLAQKIAAKENGYFYAQISLSQERKADVLLKIIEEYNNCK